jgi:vacuolar protein sorting-associated protein VTA1
MKKVKPFLRLAHDLKSEGSAETRVIAYYCEKHAVEVALPLLQALQQQGAADPPQAFVLQLMDLVEADKAQLGDAFSDELQSRKLVGNYALKVFKKADDEDRAGLSNKGTARTYLVAVRLLKAMSQFADDPSDEKHYDQILKYAMVKAASIMRAIKAGVRPTPGPPSSGEGDAMISGEFFLMHYL